MEKMTFEGTPERIAELKKYLATYIKMKGIAIVEHETVDNLEHETVDNLEHETKEKPKRKNG